MASENLSLPTEAGTPLLIHGACAQGMTSKFSRRLLVLVIVFFALVGGFGVYRLIVRWVAAWRSLSNDTSTCKQMAVCNWLMWLM